MFEKNLHNRQELIKVHRLWSSSLRGKKGWFANDIVTLNAISKVRYTEPFVDGVYSVCYKGTKERPFHSELREENWRYFKEDKYRGGEDGQRQRQRQNER